MGLANQNINQLNEAIFQVLRALYSSQYINAFTLLTGLGDPYVILPAVGAVGIVLLITKRYAAAMCWLLTIIFGFALGDLTKHIVAIPRPEGLIYTSLLLSYPSGHALGATLFYGLSAFFLQDSLKPNLRWIPWSIVVILISLISFSRIYLGDPLVY